MKRYKIWLLLLAVAALVLAGGAYIAVEHVLPYSGICPSRYVIEHHPQEFPNGYLPGGYGMVYETVNIQAQDSVTITSYFITAPSPRATILVLHGIADCKERYYQMAKRLVDKGCNVVLVDLRAHGKSGGKYCTFGYYEKDDMQRLITEIGKRDSVHPIGIYGVSLGGAVALQTLGIDQRLKFGIIESTFNEFEKVSVEYGKRFFGFRSPWLAHHINTKSGVIAKFPPEEVRPVESARKITCPMLMIHGDADARIPIAFGQDNFAALGSKEKEFYTVRGAGHDNLKTVAGEKFYETIGRFLEKQISSVNTNKP